LQCRDGFRKATGLEAREAEIVLDDGIGRLQQGCLAQGRDGISRSSGPEKLCGQRKQRLYLIRLWLDGQLHRISQSTAGRAEKSLP